MLPDRTPPRWVGAAGAATDSAKLNGLDPYAYMRDVLERLPQPASRIGELLPHRWAPPPAK